MAKKKKWRFVDREGDETKAIRVKVKNKEMLGRMGTTNETYDDVIIRLMDFWDEKWKLVKG